VSYYYPRSNLCKLFRQFFNYGILRVNVVKKHLDAFRCIHFLPPVFVASLVLLGIGGIFQPLLWKALLLIVGLYISYILVGAAATVLKIKKLRYFIALPFVFATMQISWGIGFLVGLVKTYK
jgi:hypothetical protein